MTIPVTNSTATPTSGSSLTSAAGTNKDYQTFLKMLTTELKNQDPMDPLDSKDFAAQLATFSGVEQQVRTNELLTAIGSALGQQGMSDLASWIGREARVAADAWFDGRPVTLSPNPAVGADRAVLVVRNAAGTIISSEDIEAKVQTIDWKGIDPSGATLPEGRYSFSLKSYKGDTLLSTGMVDTYAPVIEARGGASGTTLVLKGGIEVAFSAVTALRQAQ